MSYKGLCGALAGIRTQDPQIKSLLLYQLSYERARMRVGCLSGTGKGTTPGIGLVLFGVDAWWADGSAGWIPVVPGETQAGPGSAWLFLIRIEIALRIWSFEYGFAR